MQGLADEDSVAGTSVDQRRACGGGYRAPFVERMRASMSSRLGSPWALVPVENGLVAELGIFKEGGDGDETEAGYARGRARTGMEANMAFSTAGLRQLRVRLLLVELVVVELVDRGLPPPRGAAKAGRPAVVGSRMRPSCSLGAFAVAGAGLLAVRSRRTNRGWGLVRELADSMNHLCLSEVWFRTMSRMMRILRLPASATRWSKSARVPYIGGRWLRS